MYRNNGDIFLEQGGPLALGSSEYVTIEYNTLVKVSSAKIQYDGCVCDSLRISYSNDNVNWTSIEFTSQKYNTCQTFEEVEALYFKFEFLTVYFDSKVKIQNIQLYTVQGFELVPKTIHGSVNFTPPVQIHTGSHNQFIAPTSFVSSNLYSNAYESSFSLYTGKEPALKNNNIKMWGETKKTLS